MAVQAVVALVIGTVLVLLVPALVWFAIVTSLCQIVRDKMRESLKTVAHKLAVALGTK
jgi:hypothetical protein